MSEHDRVLARDCHDTDRIGTDFVSGAWPAVAFAGMGVLNGFVCDSFASSNHFSEFSNAVRSARRLLNRVVTSRIRCPLPGDVRASAVQLLSHFHGQLTADDMLGATRIGIEQAAACERFFCVFT